MFGPYLMVAKIIAVVSLIAGIVFGSYQVIEHFRDQGRQEVQTKLDDSNRVIRRLREAAVEEARNKAINEEVINEYHKEINALDIKYRADIDALNKRGGLRLPTPPCRRPAPDTEATSASGIDDEATTRLPSETEQSLYDLAKDRDKVILEHTALQEWAIEHGFAK